jgi:HEAT repeat protein
MQPRILLAVGLALLPMLAWAGPISREEADRQTGVLTQLKASLAAAASDADKVAILGGVMGAERDANFRRRVLELAAEIAGPQREKFLISVLTTDEDGGLRSQAATLLGQTGSEECLAALVKSAASDRTTMIIFGDVGGRSSARRSATFAIAELAQRHPKIADKAAAELRALPDKLDLIDRESLGDARLQALFQVTRDEALLKPFFERITSDVASTRRDGVNAFQFLKLKVAPPEVVAALNDPDAFVRANAALVLGNIKDPKTVEPLMAIASDAKADRLTRVNAIGALGQMRAKPAGELMEKLLSDDSVAANAAIALYRITGKKVEQFPAGYNAD